VRQRDGRGNHPHQRQQQASGIEVRSQLASRLATTHTGEVLGGGRKIGRLVCVVREAAPDQEPHQARVRQGVVDVARNELIQAKAGIGKGLLAREPGAL
jgi:hypothetical protein